jgi:hypothetical protein
MLFSSLYYIVENNPSSIDKTQALIDSNNLNQFRLFLSDKAEILSKFIPEQSLQ